MRVTLRYFLATLLVALVSFGSRANAQIMYAVDGAGGNPTSLYTVNTATGAATLVGATGATHVTALDFHPTTGVLYAVADSGFAGTPQLVTLNTTTGAATVVGGLGANFAGIPDMSFAPDGTLYGWTESSDELITINTATGAATLVGSDIGTSNTGLAVNAAGDLFVKSSNDLFRISTVDGTTISSSTLTGPGPDTRNAMVFDWQAPGTLYSINGSGGGGTRTSFLSTIDQNTNTWAIVGNMGFNNMSAIAIQRAGGASAPEPASLLLFGIGLVVTGGIVRRRR